MWSNLNSSIGGASGGFLNSSRNTNDGSRGSFRRVENLVPVMIQHLTRPGLELQIWGMPIRTISFIATVKYMERSSTKVTYEFEDETDRITGFQWLEVGKTTPEPVINLNTYVRVHGHLREQNDKKHVLILKIWPMTRLNELTTHLLEVTHVILKAKQKMLGPQNKTHNTTSDITMTDDNNLSGLSKEQAMVFHIIQKENETENGINRNTLKARVPRSILSDVDNIIDFLISEGHIYTTLTDDHFKTT